MSKARDIANSTETLDVDGGTIKLDGNYPVGTGNVALGDAALDSNVSGASNTAIGSDALTANTASYNTAVGYQALYSTTGGSNTAIGYQAGQNITTGVNNTALGRRALHNTTTGSANYGIGDAAGRDITTGNYNVVIGGYGGNQNGLNISTSNNNIVLSDGAGNPRVVVDSSGFMGVNKVAPTATLHVDRGAMANAAHFSRSTDGTLRAVIIFSPSSGGDVGSIDISDTSTSYTTSSDYRLKENVVELTGATTRLKQLEPKRFNFIADADTTVDGFLAHEVQSVVPEAISGEHNEVDDDGNPVYQGIDQSKLVPLLVATIKELEARITALENA